VTLGLIKTLHAKSMDVIFVNSTTKYSVLAVLAGALFIAIYRGYHINDTFYLLNDMVVLDN